MTNKELHEKAMNEVSKLTNSDRYDESTKLMRMSCCEYLRLKKLSSVHEQGLGSYYDIGDILLSAGEDFGDRKNKKESFEFLDKRTEKELQDLYKCKLTGEYCVARNMDFHSSDIVEGHHNEVMVNIDIQMRCTSFKFREGLIEKLKKLEGERK